MAFFPSVKQFFTRVFTDIMVNKKMKFQFGVNYLLQALTLVKKALFCLKRRSKRGGKENRNKEVVFKEKQRS